MYKNISRSCLKKKILKKKKISGGEYSFNLTLGNFNAILPINKYVAPNFTEGMTYVLNKPFPSKFSKKWTEFLTIVPESNLKIAVYEKGCYTTPYPIEGSTAVAVVLFCTATMLARHTKPGLLAGPTHA